MFDTRVGVEAELDAAAPCAGLVTALDRLSRRVERLDPAAQLAALEASERLASFLAALQGRILTAVAASADATAPPGVGTGSAGRIEVAAALRISPSAAGSRLHVASELAGRLHATGLALRHGQLTYLQARTLVEAVAALDDTDAVDVARRMAEHYGLNLGRWKDRLRRVVIDVAPHTADTAARQAADRREVTFQPADHGAAGLYLYGPAAPLRRMYDAADSHATHTGDDDHRSIDQRRFDAFIDLFDRGIDTLLDPDPPITITDRRTPDTGDTDGATPAPGQTDTTTGEITPTRRQRRARRGETHVVIDLPTLLRLRQHPGDLTGYGPIPPELARLLAADTTWRALITDPGTGQIIDLGAHTYEPSIALRRYIAARDHTCTAPWCTTPADTAHYDHLTPWADGGQTTAANGAATCPRDHLHTRHTLGWQPHRHPDGTYTWTSPLRRTYTTPPTRYHPDG